MQNSGTSAVSFCIIIPKGARPDRNPPGGVKSAVYRAKVTMTYYSAQYASPIGELTLVGDEAGNLAGLWIKGQKYFLGSLPEAPVPREDMPVLTQAKSWLDRYFAGRRPAPSELPLAPIGGAFRREIWKRLCEVPYGEVTTYGALSRSLSAPTSARAVGGAVGRNPISIIIPCHRVVGSGGRLTGYAGGLENKVWLLTHEGVDPERLRTAARPKGGAGT